MALMAGRPSPALLTRGQFHERIMAGEYDDVRVVLEQGRVIEIPPGGPPHAMAITRLYGLLTRALPRRYWFARNKAGPHQTFGTIFPVTNRSPT